MIGYLDEARVEYLKIDIPVHYGEEDIPKDFPLRQSAGNSQCDRWIAIIHIESGHIINWPANKKGRIHLKVCDEGSYYLLDTDFQVISSIKNQYVPNQLIPPRDGFGDMVCLDINEKGDITNWYNMPQLNEFG